ncbi:MAG: hypothetical protein HKL88_05550 [Bacteroidia bacterium]|nr:hypothetical protein [Bacteroidia bacterium]
MKKTLLFSFLLISIASFANEIDLLNTGRDVQTFLRSHFPAFSDAQIALKDFLYPDALEQKVADSLDVKLWQKADFDGNGKTDLLVYMNTGGKNYLTVIMDNGKSFRVIFLSRYPFAEVFFPVIKKLGSTPLLILYKTCSYCHGPFEGITGTDSLIFPTEPFSNNFGNFVEPANAQHHYKIEKIEAATAPCTGTCPVFSMSIEANRKAGYHAIKYNDTTGNFTAVIDTMNYKKITSLLNYINFPQKKDNYNVTWTDDQAITLTITYDGGKVKKIYDYGERGSYGLNLLYSLIYQLRTNQEWR